MSIRPVGAVEHLGQKLGKMNSICMQKNVSFHTGQTFNRSFSSTERWGSCLFPLGKDEGLMGLYNRAYKAFKIYNAFICN